MRIDGLTEQQCRILDKLWVLDTTAELFAYFETLNDDEFQMALVLQDMLMQEFAEQENNNLSQAKDMLENIGVNCG